MVVVRGETVVKVSVGIRIIVGSTWVMVRDRATVAIWWCHGLGQGLEGAGPGLGYYGTRHQDQHPCMPVLLPSRAQ